MEGLVIETRRQLADGLLGEAGAAAIRQTLIERGETRLPAVRTIGRILERRGLLDARRRVRRPAPPPGWYLPDLAARRVELDSFDAIVGLRLLGGADVEVLTAMSVHGGLAGAWPASSVISPFVTERLVQHWRSIGLPGYAQFDNDTRFLGTHGHPDVLGWARSHDCASRSGSSRSSRRSVSMASRPRSKRSTVSGRRASGSARSVSIWPA
jgi:hypothetical protein